MYYHNVLCANKNYWTCEETRKCDPQSKENQLKTDPKMTQILHLTDKGFKAASINMFKDLKEKIIIMNAQMGKSNRNRIYVKTTTITNRGKTNRNSELKISTSEMKSSVWGQYKKLVVNLETDQLKISNLKKKR